MGVGEEVIEYRTEVLGAFPPQTKALGGIGLHARIAVMVDTRDNIALGDERGARAAQLQRGGPTRPMRE